MPDNSKRLAFSFLFGALWSLLCSVANIYAWESIPGFLIVTIGCVMIGLLFGIHRITHHRD